MVRFTVLAEMKHEPFASWLKRVSERFPGFSVTHTEGYWEGKREYSFALSVIVAGCLHDLLDRFTATSRDLADLKVLAEDYRVAAGQSEVWLTQEDIGVIRMTPNGVLDYV